jgi:AAA+ ATPase superfamily predicted ATPase
MNIMQFVGRKYELEILSNFYNAPGSDLLILYGRRRIGKTRLLNHFLETEVSAENGLYWSATTHDSPYQLRSFSQALLHFATSTNLGSYSTDFSFPDWETALHFLAEEIAGKTKKRVMVVIDEYTYIAKNNPPVTSVFQKLWDHTFLQMSNIKLVLTGSLVGMMERDVISAKAPLYSRATTSYRLRPLPYAVLTEIFPERSPLERIAIYAVCGGIPAYLEMFTRRDTFIEALSEVCLRLGSLLLTDPALILYEQLQKPQTYESVISAIAAGYHNWNEIVRISKVPEGSLGNYINVLLDLEIIERRDPLLGNPRGRQGLYHVRDDFLRFYYRFIAPEQSRIDQGRLKAVAEDIYDELRGYIGCYTLETLCKEWVWAASAMKLLAFTPKEVGAYWSRKKGNEVQLDVVAANRPERQLLIGEAKWVKGKLGRSVLSDLVERSQKMPQVGAGWDVQYVLFSRDGFTEPIQKAADEIGAILVDPRGLEDTLVAEYRSRAG